MDQRNIQLDDDSLKSLTKQMLELSRQTKNYYRSLSSVGEVLSSIGKTVHNIFEAQVEKQTLRSINAKIKELKDTKKQLEEDVQNELLKGVVKPEDQEAVKKLFKQAAIENAKYNLQDQKDLDAYFYYYDLGGLQHGKKRQQGRQSIRQTYYNVV